MWGCRFRVARVSVRQCDVTGSVTLSDRDRGVTVPDRRGFSPEINPVCFRFMSSMRVPRSVISCGEMVRVPSRHTPPRMSLRLPCPSIKGLPHLCCVRPKLSAVAVSETTPVPCALAVSCCSSRSLTLTRRAAKSALLKTTICYDAAAVAASLPFRSFFVKVRSTHSDTRQFCPMCLE